MKTSDVHDLITKAEKIITDEKQKVTDRKLIEQSLKHLNGELYSEMNELYEFIQHPELQEQLDNNLIPDPDVHPFVKIAAEELQILMNNYVN